MKNLFFIILIIFIIVIAIWIRNYKIINGGDQSYEDIVCVPKSPTSQPTQFESFVIDVTTKILNQYQAPENSVKVFRNCQMSLNDSQNRGRTFEIDAYFPKYKLILEIHGPLHFSMSEHELQNNDLKSLNNRAIRDLEKRALATMNNYKIIEVACNISTDNIPRYVGSRLFDKGIISKIQWLGGYYPVSLPQVSYSANALSICPEYKTYAKYAQVLQQLDQKIKNELLIDAEYKLKLLKATDAQPFIPKTFSSDTISTVNRQN